MFKEYIHKTILDSPTLCDLFTCVKDATGCTFFSPQFRKGTYLHTRDATIQTRAISKRLVQNLYILVTANGNVSAFAPNPSKETLKITKPNIYAMITGTTRTGDTTTVVRLEFQVHTALFFPRTDCRITRHSCNRCHQPHSCFSGSYTASQKHRCISMIGNHISIPHTRKHL